MSKKGKNTKEELKKTEAGQPANKKNGEGAAEEFMTKYDRKMAAYKKQEEQEKREKLITDIVCCVIVAAVVAWIASFPIRTALAVNEAYFEIDGQKVTKVEYDYQYALAKNNYLNQYASYFSMFGMTDLSDIENQWYSDDLTFGDYFAQLAVESITSNRALLREAGAAGFTYDTTAEYEETLELYKEEASKAGVTLDKYLKSIFGSYATERRLRSLQKDAITASAYYNEVKESKKPADSAIEAYYQENKDDYDVVDYYVEIVNAELPTTKPDGTLPVDEDGNETTYQPTETEIQTAMNVARRKANLVSEKEDFGELNEAQSRSYLSSAIRDYLFDAERVSGDIEVLEDSYSHRYHVVKFVKRYRVEDPTVNIYAIVVEDEDSKAILEKWQSGEATEESFAALAKEYAQKANSTGDGSFEGVDPDSLEEEMANWLKDAGRKKGDTAAFTDSEEYGYVFYYLDRNDPVYRLSISNTLTSEEMETYMEQLTEGAAVTDEKNHLVYLHVGENADSEEPQAEEETPAE